MEEEAEKSEELPWLLDLCPSNPAGKVTCPHTVLGCISAGSQRYSRKMLQCLHAVNPTVTNCLTKQFESLWGLVEVSESCKALTLEKFQLYRSSLVHHKTCQFSKAHQTPTFQVPS